MQMIRERRGSLGVAMLAAIYAKALHIAGATEDATAALDEALAMMERNGELLWEANAHTLMGELCLAESDRGQAETEACFRRAMDAARRHIARMWELRAVPRLTRLWQSQGRLPRPATSSLLSTAGSPRGSTPPT